MRSDVRFDDLFRKYIKKPETQLRQLCRPLCETLDIPVFAYVIIEPNGRCCHLSNALETLDFLYQERFYLSHPYLKNPKFFRSGYVFSPLSADKDLLDKFQKRYSYDQDFAIFKKTANRLEAFYFASNHLGLLNQSSHFLEKIDLLEKFANYFKREAAPLIGRCSLNF